MRNVKKWTGIASAAILALSLSTVGVMAIETSAETPAQTNYFKFENGAAVRLIDDTMGEAIRFQSTIDGVYYENLVKDHEAKNVTLKSVVTDANDESKTPLIKEWVLIGEGAIEIDFNDATNEANFYHTIVFEDIFGLNNEELSKLVSALEFKAEMYIEVSDGENEPTKLTATNGITSVIRSARTIANKAYDTYKDDTAVDTNSGLTKAQRLEKYFGTRTEVTQGIYFEAGENLNTVVAKGVADTFDFASAEVYGYKETVAGNLPTAETFASTLGSTAAVSFTMFDKNNNILNVNAENAMYVTKALKTEADLKVFDIVDDDDKRVTQAATVIDGYYVLANNIKNDADVGANQHLGMAHNKEDTTSSTYKPSWIGSSAAAVGFVGTFDGQGYTMAFDVYQAGLFGVLQPGAIIKNVGMDVSFTNTQNTMSVIIAMQAPKSSNSNTQVTLQNAYINVDDFRTVNNSSNTAMFAYTDGAAIEIKNVVMNIGSVVLNEDTVASGAIYMQDRKIGTNTGYFNNVFVISPTPMWMSMDENTTAENRNAKTVSISDVSGHTNAADTNSENNGTLKYAMGNVSAGTLLIERNSQATGSIHCQTNVFRHNSLVDLMTALNDGSITNGTWRLSTFKAENGWDTTSGVPVWKTFVQVKNA